MISVILPLCNISIRNLNRLLSAFFLIRTGVSVEMLIADAGSGETKKQIVAKYATHGFIRYIKINNGWCFIDSCNFFAANASSRYLLFMPPDVDCFHCLFPKVLETMPGSNEGIVFKIDNSGNNAGAVWMQTESVKDLLSRVDLFGEKQAKRVKNSWICLLCRKSDFRRLKGFRGGFSGRVVADGFSGVNMGMRHRKSSDSEPSNQERGLPGRCKQEDNKILKTIDSEHKEAEKVVKQLRYKFLNLGFVERAYKDLEELATASTNVFMRRLAARELAAWHANQYSKEGAKKCLGWLSIAKKGETDPGRLRQAAVLEAECLGLLGQPREAQKVIEKITKKEAHADLYLARANLEKALSHKMFWINKALALHGLSEVTCDPPKHQPLYDGLRTAKKKTKRAAILADPPGVTIIIPAYNAQDTIHVALDSVLCQTWPNTEIIVVDDCSTDSTTEVVSSYAKKYNKIKLIRTEVNQGPYVARNMALQEASGEFVTVNDSDDWSHPQKIETQALHLEKHPEIIANTSELSRAYSDLRFFRRGQTGAFIQLNMSSFMFRRKKCIEAVGYWDSVRFGADGEYKRRIQKYFGSNSVADLKTGPLSFLRQTETSLTGNDAFGYPGYFMGARKEYFECVDYYHGEKETLFFDFPQKNRVFPAPEPMWPFREKKYFGKRHFDVVIASDFRLPGGTSSSNIEEIKAQKKIGLRTGLVQMSRYDISPGKINPRIRQLIEGDHVQMLVYGEKISCELLIVRHPPVLQVWQKYLPDIESQNIRVIVNQTPRNHYGSEYRTVYDFKSCLENLFNYWGHTGIWHPIGPLIRAALQEKHSQELQELSLADSDWHNIIDTKVWRRSHRPRVRNRVVIGRHSRDDKSKWPDNRDEILQIYPESEYYDVRILGGAQAPKDIIGYRPKNWTVYEFGSMHPKAFLSELDVFLYYTHPELVEAFGRVMLEAMAVGVPVILPHKFRVLFGEAAVYAKPNEVKAKIDQLLKNDDLYEKQVDVAYAFVKAKFSHDTHAKRLEAILPCKSFNPNNKIDTGAAFSSNAKHNKDSVVSDNATSFKKKNVHQVEEADMVNHTNSPLKCHGFYPPGVKQRQCACYNFYLSLMTSNVENFLEPTILRNASVNARNLLAWRASNKSLNYEELMSHFQYADSDLQASGKDLKFSFINVNLVIRLAVIMAKQSILNDDKENALNIFQVIVSNFNSNNIKPYYSSFFTELALSRRRFDLARAFFNRLDFKKDDRRIMACDLANPTNTGSNERCWLDLLSEFFLECGLEPVDMRPYDQSQKMPFFDRLFSKSKDKIHDGPLVSVIISAWSPGRPLLTSLASILAQTWKNLEIIIVDDASPKFYEHWFEHCRKMDTRVKIVRHKKNMGTYAARNSALKVAEGEYVTFQDSDDWSHPRRIELQVHQLQREKDKVCCQCYFLNTDENLSFYNPGRPKYRVTPCSLLYDRIQVLDRIGFFDTVRKAADNEYINRIKAVFGNECLTILPEIPLGIYRQVGESLSISDFASGWRHPSRSAYTDAYNYWHELICQGKSSPYRSSGSNKRKFPSPLRLLISGKTPTYDLVIVGDWRNSANACDSMLNILNNFSCHNANIAICQMESFEYVSKRHESKCDSVRSLIHNGKIHEIVMDDVVNVSLVVLFDPVILQFPPATKCSWVFEKAIIIVQDETNKDGKFYPRYVFEDCAKNFYDIFGLDPLWFPADTRNQYFLKTRVPQSQLLESSTNLYGLCKSMQEVL